MKPIAFLGALTLPAALVAGLAFAQSQAPVAAGVESLRGAQPDEEIATAPVFHQDKQRFVRNYRLQPPLIPHSIDKYQIDLKANECLGCHEWRTSGDRGAPTLSMTHYQNRDGVQTDTVATRRWFCNQCHVPQADAPALVENIFQSSGQ
ncbi:nitrate reductase cytochrome c-type subunit [Cereibacter sphaeroides]|uniref:nitrate reductase cytochrome c-type subunit n=1 Tax=Rhodobacterales TaxID=204455 RepID=UPI000BBE59B4|nr:MULTISPECIES: nitrate reductase cytochrome c-type subunit [Paracoccaceae]MCE6950846.1 nitrate reductase cytochrome c-type subunit [Cereibacter sphaeroides]MCE6959867.1 nitrate reductase cytochrome c-type subunit [Cereibacter sphaeroides]MCE6968665.1 nitrate reductase cytochrome c-type subunit [Cereibacter sphaeroides]MCE6974721.1 nitrate reductase cytochrome c-type subunit [Cereibacter sphaeroides]